MDQFGKLGRYVSCHVGPVPSLTSQSHLNTGEKWLRTGTALPLNPCPPLSEQSEDDIDVLAFGKQQAESIANPLYETSTPAPPESSCDPFTVSSHFTLGQGSSGVQNAAFQQRSEELHPGKSTLLECVSDSTPSRHFFIQKVHLFREMAGVSS